MSPSSDQGRPAKSARVPHSFFYDRVAPALLALIGFVFVLVIVLVIGALVGVIPVK
jgi:hypothetical protein